MLIAALTSACATPQVQPIQPAQIVESDLLSFLERGATRRTQVLLNLGTPSGRYESDRILTYQIRIDSDGEPRIFWPRPSTVDPVLTHWDQELHSLVLVFDDTGVLQEFSLVGAK